MRVERSGGKWFVVFESGREKRSLLGASQTAYFTKDGRRWVISGAPLSALSIARKCHGRRVVVPKLVAEDIGDPAVRGLETDHEGIVIKGALVKEHGYLKLLVPSIVAKILGGARYVAFEPNGDGFEVIPLSGTASRVGRRKRAVVVSAPPKVRAVWVVSEDGRVVLK